MASSMSLVHGLTLSTGRARTLVDVLIGAAQTADRPVIYRTVKGERRSSHRGLLEEAERACGGLRARGVKPGDRVVLVLDGGEVVLPAFWGCLLAGAVPLVMEPPEQFTAGLKAFDQLVRVVEMLDGPLVVVDAACVDAAVRLSKTVVGHVALGAGPRDGRHHRADPDDLAFLCFSSGSTGVPKCIMLTHRCVLERNAGTNQHNGHRADDVNLNWLPFDHIGSLTEHMRSLELGCALVYIDKDAVLEDPLHLLDVIDRHRITHTWGPNFVYALIGRALDERAAEIAADRWDLSCVRFLISGGEAASRDAMGGFLDRAARFGFPKTGFRPSFGMVEVSAGITYFIPTAERPLGFVWLGRVGVPGEAVEVVGAERDGARAYASLGRPIAGCTLRVVDGDDRVVPEGVIGRVQFAGAPLAAGYLDDPERTARVFGADGWLETGDLGCVLDGELVLTGRTKDMLIINGVNYYCRALEEVVEGVEGVELSFTAACAVADPDGGAGERLAIFFCPADGDDADGRVRAVRAALVRGAGINPHFIVPLGPEQVPKTAIGKIRRVELGRRFEAGHYGAPDAQAAELRPPRTPLESALVTVWSAALGRAVGIDDHFFEAGGDSIKAVSVVSRIQSRLPALARSISLFDTPTIASLAAWIEEDGPAALVDPGSAPAITADPASACAPFPLTAIQQAYWAGRSAAFDLGGRSVHAYCEFEGHSLDPERLEQAWNALVARHPNLRTVIESDGTQRVLPDVPRYAMPFEDLAAAPAAEREARLRALRDASSHGVLPCETWPTFDIRLVRLPDDRLRIFTRFDALFFDARSRFIVFGEWGRLYAGEADLPPLELTFRDYVLQAEEDAAARERDRAWWLDRLDDLPEPPKLPLAVTPGSLGTPRFFQLERRIDQATWRRLQGAAARFGITPSGLLLAVFADGLRPWSQNPRFLLNLTTYRRLPMHPQVNDVVGDFSALSLLAVEAPGTLDFVGRARALQHQLMRDLGHGAFSGVDVLRALARRRPEGLLAPIVFTSVLGDELQAPGGTVTDWLGEVVHDITQTPQIFFDHIAFEEGGALQIRWNVVEGLFPPGVIEAIFDGCGRHLARLAVEDAAWRAAWRETRGHLLPAEQLAARAQINDTAVEVEPELLDAAFRRQALAEPDRPAVIAADRTLDYGTLAAESNRLGRHLVRRGAAVNTLIAVAVDKGWAQIVGVFGVLAAGAAYLPVDPGLPPKRMADILAQGAVWLVVTTRAHAATLEVPAGVEVVILDDEAVAAESDAPIEPKARPTDLAYVIFTSGSTGRPKGVTIDHRGAHNTVVDINRRFAVGPDDRVLALSALSFDLSVYDIFGLLAVGGAMVMPDAADVREPGRWIELVEQHRITLWNTVPAFVDVLLGAATGARAARLASLRLVMMSGDWIPLPLPARIVDLPGRPRAISLGGATEASIWSIWHPIEGVEPQWTSIPYGRPLDNQTFHVLDDALEPCPDHVAGMLYIGGIGVALGYFGDAERTAASFLSHPRTGERLYRTGDRGRFVIAADGRPHIEFLGRVDLQVKVQGFRVELGDIESALTRHPAVEHAVAVARGDRHADKVLVAYVVPAAPVDEDALRRHLAALVPAYMVPTRFMLLDRFPLTSNGKVDRRALPEPGPVERVPAPSAPARTADGGIGAVVSQVLDRPVGPEDDLFDLGATSVDVMRIVNRIAEQLGLTVSVGAVFETPTVAGIAVAAGIEATDGTAEDDLLARYPAVIDPEARAAFARAEHGLRSVDGPSIHLDSEISPAVARVLAERRSHRVFDPEPVPIAALGELLSGLRRFAESDGPRYGYGSAGGLYPVQVGLYVKPGRVDGLDGGFYHHDRAAHRLVRLADADFDPAAYAPADRAVWRGAAFGLYLMVDLSAIVPLYREASLRFAAIEAGLMSQLLEMLAPAVGIGLCQMGHVGFDHLRAGFAVSDDHRLVHSSMGGLLPVPDDWVEEEF